MHTRYIAIEREYGSGGTRIARRLSEETGVPCYGREILEAVSRKYRLSTEEIEKYEETVTNSFLYSIYVMAQASSGKADMLSREGHIYIAEQAAIQDLARQGRAIFLGHCAAEALKGEPGTVRVFIRCSDESLKKQRIREDYGIPAQLLDSTQKRFDRKRANYYAANTGRKWDDCRNYDLILDSGVLGLEGCAALLRTLLEQ
ncbi:MAG: AAA family ATPase [Oscillospiraceae bacterium]